jgi:hypothetical protein
MWSTHCAHAAACPVLFATIACTVVFECYLLSRMCPTDATSYASHLLQVKTIPRLSQLEQVP